MDHMEESQVPSEGEGLSAIIEDSQVEEGLSALIGDSQVPSEGLSELAADTDDEVEALLFGPPAAAPAPDDGDDGRRGHMYIIYL